MGFGRSNAWLDPDARSRIVFTTAARRQPRDPARALRDSVNCRSRVTDGACAAHRRSGDCRGGGGIHGQEEARSEERTRVADRGIAGLICSRIPAQSGARSSLLSRHERDDDTVVDDGRRRRARRSHGGDERQCTVRSCARTGARNWRGPRGLRVETRSVATTVIRRGGGGMPEKKKVAWAGCVRRCVWARRRLDSLEEELSRPAESRIHRSPVYHGRDRSPVTKRRCAWRAESRGASVPEPSEHLARRRSRGCSRGRRSRLFLDDLRYQRSDTPGVERGIPR